MIWKLGNLLFIVSLDAMISFIENERHSSAEGEQTKEFKHVHE